MSKFDDLQRKHNELLTRLEAQGDVMDPREIEAFIQEVQLQASEIISPLEREQLRANLRVWASYLYGRTGEYPDTTLKTPDPEKSRQFMQAEAAPRKPGWVWALGATLGIIVLIYGISAITSWLTASRTVALQQTEVAVEAATQLNLSISQTAEATRLMLPATWTPTATDTLEPTPSPTPTPTPEVINPTLTTRPEAGIQILVENLGNASTIPANTVLTGIYEGLAPGSSIHILLQPINQCGLDNILVPDYYLVEKPSGQWEIPVNFGKDSQLLAEEQYNIRIYFAQNQDAREALSRNQYRFNDCFNAADLPLGVFPYSPVLVNVNRSRYEARLVFATRTSDSNYYDLATTRLDGSDFRLLTDTPKADEQEPHVCQGNQKIVYVDKTPTRGPQNQIWVMDLKGGNPELLVTGSGVQYERPSWSPDCKYIAYDRMIYGEGESWKIEIIEYEQRELGPSILGMGRYPTWMPEGHNLVFNHLIVDRAKYPSFALVDLDTCRLFHDGKESSCRQDTSRFKYQGTPVQGLQPAISPDGKHMAFVTYVQTQGDKKYQYIQGFDLDGRSPVYNLTTSAGLYTDWCPAWGPDPVTPTVYFQSRRKQNINIWSVEVEGANLTPIGPSERTNITVTYQLLAVDLLGP